MSAVRAARPDDVDAIIAGFRAVVDERVWLGTEPGFDVEERRRRIRDSLDGDAVAVFVAERDEAVVGSITGLAQGGPVELYMWVQADARGQGVGRALVDALIDWARARGHHKLALQVWPHNERAIALYRRCGFAEEGLLRRQYRRANGELWDAIVMGLVLDEAAPGFGGIPPKVEG